MAERLSTGLVNEMIGPGGQSMADALEYGVVRIYSGVQPAGADSAETGTLLLEVTKASAATTTPMTSSNGLSFDAAVGGISPKADAEVWSGVGLADGAAGWFRFYDKNIVTGASTTAIRFDGNIATSGSDMDMANTAITTGGTTTIDGGGITLPKS